MSDEQGASKLVVRAEALLAQAELREPDYDALAKRIEGALATAGQSDDSLLLPPLPESVDDGRLSPAETAEPKLDAVAASATPAPEPASEREGASLADLARAALARRESKDRVSIAKESLAIATQQRTPAAPATAKALPTIETDDTRDRKRSTIPPARRSRAAFDTRGPWIGVGVAAIGLAAGFGLYLAGNRKTEIIQVPVAANTPNAAPPVTTQTTAESAPTAKTLTPDMLPRERGAPAPMLTPDALARESASSKAPASVADARPVAPGERPAGPAAVAGGATATTGAGAAKPERIVLEEEHAAGDAGPARPSKPPAATGLRPAELNANGGIADKPSTGAAQAAVGAVLGAARSCIAGQPQGSSATLVFGSSGEVTSVSVSGPAEGTPAAACIQSALKKARVQPFAASNFSLGVTIRPP
ncbi:MAG TPA: hypothetical protein VNN72_08830 [Polyangiaceae bacterium]|nr:hypothetical protein [Polyangiaceae bacterium]